MSIELLSIRVLIVEQEIAIIEQITDVLSNFKEFNWIETCKTGLEAIEIIQGQHPDLVFMETELTDMTGFDLMQRIFPVSAPQFVFITSTQRHAVKAFEYYAFDYIVKPFTSERLYLTLMKVKEEFMNKSGEQLQEKLNALFRYVSSAKPAIQETAPTNGSNLLPVKMGGRIYFIREEEVQYIVASGYYIEIYANGKKHLLRQSLRGIIQRLDQKKFLRIHRSVIISLKYLKEITRQGTSDFNARMDDGASFKISKSYKGNVFEQIGIGS